MKLRTKFLLSTLIITISSSLILVIFFHYFSTNILKNEIGNHLTTITMLKAKQIDLLIQSYEQFIDSIKTDSTLYGLLEGPNNYNEKLKTAEKKLKSILQMHPDIARIRLADKSGKIIASTMVNDRGLNILDSVYFKKVEENSYQTDIRESELLDKPVLTLSVSILSADRFSGALTIDYNFSRINQIVNEKNKYWANSNIYLINYNGRGITSLRDIDNSTLEKQVMPEDIQTGFNGLSGENNNLQTVPLVHKNYSGKKVVSIYHIIPAIASILVAETPIEDAYKPVSYLSQSILISYLFFLLAVVIIFNYLIRYYTSPLKKLINGIRRIGSGDMDFHLNIDTHDEIGELSDTFNKMVISIKKARESIIGYNKNLEKMVAERTGELRSEIDERKKTEQELIKSEEKYRILTEQSVEFIYWKAVTGKINYVSPNCLAMTGYSQKEYLGNSDLPEKIVDKEDREILDKLQYAFKKREQIRNLQFRIRKKDKKVRWFRYYHIPIYNSNGDFIGFRCSNTDITDYKKLEEEFRQAQKMEAIGRLAGGVAHDFNNLLTVIQGSSEMILLELNKNSSIYPLVEQIMEAGKRAESLTRQLLAFSRKQTLQPKVINLNKLIRDMEKMIKRLIGEDIIFSTNYSNSRRKIKADPGQIEQIILNLVVNARDAMPEGGELEIETQDVTIAEQDAELLEELTPGDYVLLSVTDTGTGMDKETKTHVFEPFFTTKESEKGTGLGLSTVYGIVKQSSGAIRIYSEPGMGTAFHIYFPATEEQHQQKDESHSISTDLTGKETVLIVEDEDDVRKVAARSLKYYKYNILEARNAGEAIDICKNYGDKISLLLTDVILPGTNGKKLSKEILKIIPRIKIIFMSGYTDNAITHYGLLDPDINFIQKPFTMQILTRKVREVLDKK
ncbi:MAG: PAS domain S-box protein [Spirochaetes bacterium]|nr:PAS domain S-box protein [Spirochaetota bacterium]